MAVTAPAFAQQTPFMEAGTAQPPPLALPPKEVAPATTGSGTNAASSSLLGPLDQFFNGKIPDALAKGKFNLNVRLRYEQADETGVGPITKDSYAPTIRTRFGYTSAPLYGFQAMVEGVNTSVLGPEHNYNAAGSNGQAARPVVADPPLTRVDQAWFGYSYTNLFTGKVGEQRIVLDNHRFIGDVGWRQNMQTFDAVSAGSEPAESQSLLRLPLGRASRIRQCERLARSQQGFRLEVARD